MGVSDISGGINNTSDGEIIVTGGGQVTFYGDIVQNGTLRVSATGATTSVAVFAGDFSGSGGATGGGDIFFEGGFSPGSSPARTVFDNDLFFSPSSELVFELAGLEPGTEYDCLLVNGTISLDGMLDVVLLDGFDPAADSFYDIIIADSIFDAGTLFRFPELGGGRMFSSAIIDFGSQQALRLTVSVIPEPSSLVYLAVMMAASPFARRRRVHFC